MASAAGRGARLDYLFIDTHPGVNEETLLSIAISDVLLLIMRPDNQDFQGTAVTVELARRLEVPEMFADRQQGAAAAWTGCAAAEGRDGRTGQRRRRMLPLNDEMARLASSGMFVNRYPDHPFSPELQKVAGRDPD